MLKRKNKKALPEQLEDSLYPDDYWLDKEDGQEVSEPLPDGENPVSEKLRKEPMVTGYEALERQRGVRRPKRKITRREKKALKQAQKYEAKLRKEQERADKKSEKREAKLAEKAEKEAMRQAKKDAKKRKIIQQRKQIQQRKNRFQHSSLFHIMRWQRMGSAGCRISFIQKRSGFMTSTISWHRMRIRTQSLKTGVIF